jgi:hypothetical protein
MISLSIRAAIQAPDRRNKKASPHTERRPPNFLFVYYWGGLVACGWGFG